MKLFEKIKDLWITDRLRLGVNSKIVVARSGNTDVELSGTELTNLDGLSDELSAINGLTATAAEINAVADKSGSVIDLDATSLTLTAATHGERIVTLSHTAAASTVTLPAATGTGNKYTFIVAAVNTNNHVIQVANATDVFEGQIITCSTGDTPDLAQPWAAGASDDTITLNGTTTGGQAIGDRIEIIDYASGKFHVLGFTTTSGTEATPFSAAVS